MVKPRRPEVDAVPAVAVRVALRPKLHAVGVVTGKVEFVGEIDEAGGIDAKGAVLGEFGRGEVGEELGEDVLNLARPATEDRLLDKNDCSWLEACET